MVKIFMLCVSFSFQYISRWLAILNATSQSYLFINDFINPQGKKLFFFHSSDKEKQKETNNIIRKEDKPAYQIFSFFPT